MAETDVAAPAGTTHEPGLTAAEQALATRNHGMPLEMLREDLTPLGLHYLLIHYDIPAVDPAIWRLQVDGLVNRPLELSLEDLRSREAVTLPVTLECAGNGRTLLSPRPISQPWLHEAVGTAAWTGVRLADVLAEAGVAEAGVEVVFEGADRGLEGGTEQQYARSLALSTAQQDEVLLAYEVNGVPLPPQHGYPLRLVVPGWYGMASVKWLERVTVTDEPFGGFYQARSYRYRQEPDEAGTPVTRIAVRSLMVPPGIPDFLTRKRYVDAGPVTLQGRAWSGDGPITAVEVSDDGGGSWWPATVDEAVGAHAWHGWWTVWSPTPGSYELCVRATDATGAAQPLTPRWNLGGYAVNAVQHVAVDVR